jgi:hypothetical protein
VIDRPKRITFAEICSAGAPGAFITLLVSACAPPSTYTPPSPPMHAAVIAGVKKAASEAKLGAPLEMSDLRPTDHGPGGYFVCVREASSTSEKHTVYSVFYNNDEYKGSRVSVIMDACEAQAFTPIESEPAPLPSPSPKSKRIGRK